MSLLFGCTLTCDERKLSVDAAQDAWNRPLIVEPNLPAAGQSAAIRFLQHRDPGGSEVARDRPCGACMKERLVFAHPDLQSSADRLASEANRNRVGVTSPSKLPSLCASFASCRLHDGKEPFLLHVMIERRLIASVIVPLTTFPFASIRTSMCHPPCGKLDLIQILLGSYASFRICARYLNVWSPTSLPEVKASKWSRRTCHHCWSSRRVTSKSDRRLNDERPAEEFRLVVQQKYNLQLSRFWSQTRRLTTFYTHGRKPS